MPTNGDLADLVLDLRCLNEVKQTGSPSPPDSHDEAVAGELRGCVGTMAVDVVDRGGGDPDSPQTGARDRR